jgi:hypothetical protein
MAIMTKKEQAKNARLQREFHITLDEYKQVLTYQQGVCYICKKKTNKKGEPLKLAVDHDHVTGEVRGLLCWTCNKGIAIFRDSEERLQNAVSYFRMPPFHAVFGEARFTAPGRVGTKARKKLLAAFNAAGKGNGQKKQEKVRASGKVQKRVR